MTTPSTLLPDLSEFQENADAQAIVKQSGGAIILRVCYGADHPDEQFSRLRADAQKAAATFIGLYQYLRESQTVAEQADAFLKLVGKLEANEIPVLDHEEGSGDQFARSAEWFAIVDKALGLEQYPINERSWLYSGDEFAIDHGLAPIFDSARHTWVAAYGATEPALPHSLWQCADGTKGIHITDWPGAGKCDTSIYHGTAAQLSALIKRGGTAVPTTPVSTPKSVKKHVTLGESTISGIASSLGDSVSQMLRLTAEYGPSGKYATDVANWINDCADPTKTVDFKEGDVPAGLTLYYWG
jgi:hypothetical protein